MPLTNDVLNALRCNVYEKDHFLNNAVILSCGHNACKECVLKKNGHDFICQFENCGKKHKIKNAHSLPVNQTVAILMQTYKDDILEQLKSDFQSSLNDLETVNLESSIESNCEFIEFEIDLKIESLKAQLDIVGENMRTKLRNLKEEMKLMIPQDQVDAARELINNMKSLSESPNGDIQEYQEKIKECKKRINNLKNNLPKLPFKASDTDIDEHFVGELNEITLPENKVAEKEEEIKTANAPPGYPRSNFSRMTRSANYNLQSSCFARLGYIKSKNEIIITDSDTGCLTVLERDTFQQITTTNPSQKLKCPVSLYVNNRDEVLVGDYASSKVHVFNEDLEHITSFGQDIIKKPFYITADPETNNIYVSDKRNDTITVWNGEEYSFIDNIKCDSPSHMQIVENKIYVVSGLYFEMSKNKKKFEKKSKGLNAILVLEKKTYEVLQKLEQPDCFDFRGLHVDKRGVVYAICDEVHQNSVISKHSRLVGIYNDYPKVCSFNLDFSNCRDMMVLDNQIIIVRGKSTPSLFVLDFYLAFSDD